MQNWSKTHQGKDYIRVVNRSKESKHGQLRSNNCKGPCWLTKQELKEAVRLKVTLSSLLFSLHFVFRQIPGSFTKPEMNKTRTHAQLDSHKGISFEIQSLDIMPWWTCYSISKVNMQFTVCSQARRSHSHQREKNSVCWTGRNWDIYSVRLSVGRTVLRYLHVRWRNVE